MARIRDPCGEGGGMEAFAAQIPMFSLRRRSSDARSVEQPICTWGIRVERTEAGA